MKEEDFNKLSSLSSSDQLWNICVWQGADDDTLVTEHEDIPDMALMSLLTEIRSKMRDGVYDAELDEQYSSDNEITLTIAED